MNKTTHFLKNADDALYAVIHMLQLDGKHLKKNENKITKSQKRYEYLYIEDHR